MNGLRQLRDATGAHQVGWRSPTVDDNDANQMPNKRVVVVRLIAICVSVAVEAILFINGGHFLWVNWPWKASGSSQPRRDRPVLQR